MAGHGASGAVITALLDPPSQLLDRRFRGVEGDGRSLRYRIRVDRHDARPVPDHPLDDRLLGGVVQVADVQDRGHLPVVGRDSLRVLVVVAHRFTSARLVLCASWYCARPPRKQNWIVSLARRVGARRVL
jgi:hypothetical protein